MPKTLAPEERTSETFAIMKFQFMAKLSSWTLLGFFLYIFAVTFGIVPKDNLPTVNTVIGFLILEIGIMIGYYFGSSQSASAHRTQEDNKQTPPTEIHSRTITDTRTVKPAVVDSPPAVVDCPPKEELLRLVEQGMSVSQIADKYSVTVAIVEKWIQQYEKEDKS
jgi:hypothetical protein